MEGTPPRRATVFFIWRESQKEKASILRLSGSVFKKHSRKCLGTNFSAIWPIFQFHPREKWWGVIAVLRTSSNLVNELDICINSSICGVHVIIIAIQLFLMSLKYFGRPSCDQIGNSWAHGPERQCCIKSRLF